MPAEDGKKALLLFSRGARPIETFDLVVGNQIHSSAEATRMTREQVRLFLVIVHAGDQNVFEIDPLLFAARVVIAGVEKGGQVVLSVNRHDLIAHLIRRTV